MIDPILITGCARSGTSLIAGIIDRCGIQGGITCGATNANRKGQYENNAIRNGVTKPFLRLVGADEMGQRPLPQLDDEFYRVISPDFVKAFRNRVLDIIGSQGVNLSRPWYIKEAKSCLIWPLWHAAFPGAHWIIVRRDSQAIAESCVRTPFMRAYSDVKGWRQWVSEHLQRFEEIGDSCTVNQIWSQDVVRGGFTTVILKDLIEYELGGTWDAKAIANFIDPTLYHLKETQRV